MRLSDCHNIADFRKLAQKRLPAPVFHYIDGAADDEITLARSTAAFNDCDLVPRVLAGVETVDMSTTLFGKRIEMPLFLSPTALQRLFHHDGERAVARAAEKFGTFCGISSLATVSLEEIGGMISTPKLFQFYYHKDRGINRDMIQAAKAAGFDALALTVDTIVGGNRERDYRTGFTSPPKLTPSSMISFATHPSWTLNYLLRERFELPNLKNHIKQGSNTAVTVSEYFTSLLDQSMDWKAAEAIRAEWGGPFCLKGVMSAECARRAIDIGASAIMISNHGGRQLDGSRAPFDQLAEIVDAVGDRLEIILDGGVRRGTHVLKALSMGARAVSGGRLYLYALAAAGQPGVERILGKLRGEIERDMKLMGARTLADLSRENLRFR